MGAQLDDPNREAVGVAPIWAGTGAPPGEGEAEGQREPKAPKAPKHAAPPAPAPAPSEDERAWVDLMAYATPAELADALEIRVTPATEQVLTDCLEAAAAEIDHCLDDVAITNPPPSIVVRTNVNRAVEWYKAPATYNGGVGFADVGVLGAPTSGFERHAAALLPLQSAWGVA